MGKVKTIVLMYDGLIDRSAHLTERLRKREVDKPAAVAFPCVWWTGGKWLR